MTSSSATRLLKNEAVRDSLSKLLDAGMSGLLHHQKIDAIIRAVSPYVTDNRDTASKEDFENSEQENSNLRKHLVWCAERLTKPQRQELQRRLRRRMEEGGVVNDSDGADELEEIRMFDTVEQLTDHVQLVIDSQTIPDNWHGRADELCSRVREFLPKQNPPLTMAQLIDGKL